mgnify:CR=1 FL=1
MGRGASRTRVVPVPYVVQPVGFHQADTQVLRVGIEIIERQVLRELLADHLLVDMPDQAAGSRQANIRIIHIDEHAASAECCLIGKISFQDFPGSWILIALLSDDVLQAVEA